MIVLDTNVLSEISRPPHQRSETVLAWLSRQSGEHLFTTSVTAAEMLSGVAIMPDGGRKSSIAERVSRILSLFEGRILSFEYAAAPHYAEVFATRRKTGRPIDSFDAVIAAIARANGMAIATRNIGDFEDCGIDLINPWDA
jgi:predicted nucleic acid-binding protein